MDHKEPKSTWKDEPENDLEAERERVFSDLKEKINLLLWWALPPSTTLAEAEELAVRYNQEIQERWGLM